MKKKIGTAVCIILIIVTVAFIWYNSFQPEAVSKKTSDIVADKVEQIVTDNGTKETSTFFDTTMKNIRKAAHAVEFFTLGVEITVLSFILRRRLRPQNLWNILSSSLAIAVVDESIQILSKRGALVRDVLIDLCGAVIGFLLVLLIDFIISSCKKGRRKHA